MEYKSSYYKTNLHMCPNRCYFNKNIIYPRSSSLKYDLIVYIEAEIYGISLFVCDKCNRHTYNICVSDIIYNVHDYSVIYNDNVGRLYVKVGV